MNPLGYHGKAEFEWWLEVPIELRRQAAKIISIQCRNQYTDVLAAFVNYENYRFRLRYYLDHTREDRRIVARFKGISWDSTKEGLHQPFVELVFLAKACASHYIESRYWNEEGEVLDGF